MNVNGMSCSHCENAVKTAVSALDGVKKVSVSLKHKTVDVHYDEEKVSLDKIKAAIDDQGYEVVS